MNLDFFFFVISHVCTTSSSAYFTLLVRFGRWRLTFPDLLLETGLKVEPVSRICSNFKPATLGLAEKVMKFN